MNVLFLDTLEMIKVLGTTASKIHAYTPKDVCKIAGMFNSDSFIEHGILHVPPKGEKNM